MSDLIKPQPKKVGLALSGGFIRATAQIGVIEVLEENGIPIDIVAGCSSGSGIAGAYVAGNLAAIKKRLAEGSSRDYWRVIFEPTFPRKGLLKGERNRKFFEEFVGTKNFKDLPKKLILAATDLRNMEQVYLADGPVSKAIQASTSVPGIFVPVRWQNYVLADGANHNLIPSQALYDHGADYVIAIDVSQPPNFVTRFFSNLRRLSRRQEIVQKIPTAIDKDLNILQLIYRTASLSSSQIHKFYHHGYRYDTLIRPDLHQVNRWNISLVNYCIQQGRQAALEQLLQIKKDLGLT